MTIASAPPAVITPGKVQPGKGITNSKGLVIGEDEAGMELGYIINEDGDTMSTVINAMTRLYNEIARSKPEWKTAQINEDWPRKKTTSDDSQPEDSSQSYPFQDSSIKNSYKKGALFRLCFKSNGFPQGSSCSPPKDPDRQR